MYERSRASDGEHTTRKADEDDLTPFALIIVVLQEPIYLPRLDTDADLVWVLASLYGELYKLQKPHLSFFQEATGNPT